MIKNAAGDCFWAFDHDTDKVSLFFVGRVESGDYEVLATFWDLAEVKFLALAVLIGEQQQVWAEWRTIAEKDGGDALREHIFWFYPMDYLEELLDVKISEQPARALGVTVSVHLRTRRVDLIRHRFQTSDQHIAFMDWANASDEGRLVDLCLIGLLQGQKALAKEMDDVATSELSDPAGFGRIVADAVEKALAVCPFGV